ncbi:MAG: selenocysteine-specific translation elongation factor [candidate division Zixibacteria bacterium]|nr:selenocysteine-specific translation elongation factor [Candidatus Tariuqbacter arcticus]
MRHTVIGTAGHIDHGKSALIISLTGYDPDRLKEEKERQMTTDLGFAFLGDDITIIDVPGHEKFIKNMLSGVSTLDIGVLVVAADDGIMPQTEEHFEILQLLGVPNGLIALTKVDLVEEEWVEMVMEDIRELVKGSFLKDAPIFPISNVNGAGIPELRLAILDMAEKLPARADRGIFRLWIDRVFTIKGAGTIVAGTVLSGRIHPGEKVDLLPQGKTLRVKKLQVHNKPREECRIGERVAINLMGVDVDEIQRGDILTAPGYFQPTYMLNAKLQYLPSCKKPLKNRTRVRLHLGTAEILCRVVNLEKGDIYPGTETIVQFRLESQIAPDVGDAFVIRDYSPGRTIGGGTILETHPQKLKYLQDERIEILETIADADPEKVVEFHLKDNPQRLFTVEVVAKERALSMEEAEEVLALLVKKNRLTKFGEGANAGYVHAEEFGDTEEALKRFLRDFHAENPLRQGIKKSELKMKMFPHAENGFFNALLNEMADKGEIGIRKERIFIAGHAIEFTPEQERLKERIEKIYYEAKFVTPEFEELVVKLGAEKPGEVRNVVTGMVESGILVELGVRLGKALIFHSDRIEEARNIVLDTIREKGEAKFYELREKLNSTRKFTTPILNHFDEIGLTKRIGDVRVLREEG